MLHLSLAVPCTRNDQQPMAADGDNRSGCQLSYYRELAEWCESGGFTALMLTGEQFTSFSSDGAGVDPVLTAASLAPLVRRIGVIAEVSTSHYEPYYIARALASLDHLTKGRSGWLLSQVPEAAASQARIRELIEVARKLWDSWQEGAVVKNKQTGVFTDLSRVGPIDFEGAHFQVQGPLNVSRPVQGHPILCQTVRSQADWAIAAAHADWIILTASRKEEAARQYRSMRRAIAEQGREPGHVVISQLVQVDFDASDGRRSDGEGWTFGGTPQQLMQEMTEWRARGDADGFHLQFTAPLKGLMRWVRDVCAVAVETGEPASLRERLGVPRPQAGLPGEQEGEA